jgi:group I intron endonuclease
MSGIYIWLNTINFKVYVGKTINFKNRLKSHKKLLRKNKHFNSHLQNAWNQYGENSFIFKIIEECKTDLLGIKEIFWVNCLKALNREFGYNNEMPTEEGGKIVSKETREKLSKTNKGNPCPTKGRPCSDHTKKLISNANRGKVGPNRGIPMRQETKDKLSTIHAKKIYQFLNPNGDIIEITNLRKFCRDNNLERSNMQKVFKGEIFSCKGWKNINRTQKITKRGQQTKNKIADSKSQEWHFIDSNDNHVIIFNLKKFCRENNFNQGAMWKVHAGKQKQYKRWRKYCEY